MAGHRITSILKTASGLVVNAPCLLYGIVLTGKTGAASATVCDFATGTAVPLSSRVLSLYKASATSSTYVPFEPPVQLSSGLFVTMTAGQLQTTLAYSRHS